MNRLYVGQIPRNPMVITVTGTDLSEYTSASLKIRDPNGAPVDSSAGTCSIDGPTVVYRWPATSLFTTPGDYRIQVALSDNGFLDMSSTFTVKVYPAMTSA